MNALRSILVRRETGIAVMIVLFTVVVSLYKPQFFTLNSLRVILLLTPLARAQEGSGDARSQQEALWARVAAEPYATLPPLGSAGFQHTFKDTAAALSKRHMRRAFDLDQDGRPVRTKTFHPFGTVAKSPAVLM